MKLFRINRLERVSLPSSCPFFVFWRAPPPGWLKVNFGGSVCSSAYRGGAGYVVRDHDGKLILASGYPLLDVSVLLVEMIAAWNAIKAAVCQIKARKLWIEGDALGIILAIRKASRADSYAANLLKDIKVCFQTLEEWKVSRRIYFNGSCGSERL